MPFSQSSALVAVLFALASASPAPTPHPRPNAVLDAPAAGVTPFRVLNEPTKTLHARADILSKIESGVGSVLTKLGSAIPSYVASGTATHSTAQVSPD